MAGSNFGLENVLRRPVINNFCSNESVVATLRQFVKRQRRAANVEDDKNRINLAPYDYPYYFIKDKNRKILGLWPGYIPVNSKMGNIKTFKTSAISLEI
jgi:hypothetical protein